MAVPSDKSAYRSGWKASMSTRDYDLDKAESRYEKRTGYRGREFAHGWQDYSSEKPYKKEYRYPGIKESWFT